MLIKIEGKGSAELDGSAILAFEELKENAILARPNAKASLFFDIGEGLTNHIVENTYDQIKGSCAMSNFQEVNLGGASARRMSIPRNSIIYKEDVDPALEFEVPVKTALKVRIGDQILTLASVQTRDEINMG